MAKPDSAHYSPTRLLPRSLLSDCMLNRVECRWRTLADTPDTALIRLLDRKCEYISDHNRLMPVNLGQLSSSYLCSFSYIEID